jgi:hypothetical protein
MPSRLLARCICLALLLPITTRAQARASQTAQASLTISCDADCTWSVDDNQHGALKKGQEAHLNVLFGVHNIEATSSDGRHWERTVEIKRPNQEQIRIGFAPGSSAAKSGPDAAVPAERAVQSDESAGGIPTFYAHSRQVIVEAEAWKPVDKKNAGDLSWIPEEALAEAPEGTSLRKVLERLPPAAKGLTAGDFHVFDNGVDQRINYFKEADFPAVASTTVSWRFDATARGIWGTLMFASGVPYTPSASYLIGYTPPALQPGECRTIQIVVPNHYIWTNRKQYCAAKAEAATTEEKTKLAVRMEKFASSSQPGTMDVSVRAFAFWSSGVLALARQTPSTGNTSTNAAVLPATDFTYTVEVHDSKAPATVQITTQFGLPYQLWNYPCRKSSAIHVLGMVYKGNGELERQFGDTFRCDMWARTPQGKVFQEFPGAKGNIPTLFDTQIELRPGEYELRVAVTDGKKFGRARLPFLVEALNGNGLTVSDVALNSILRDASWIVRDATDATPAPIVPTPLVSKNVQFLLVSDAELHRDNPLSVYFEIYEPLLETRTTAVSFRVRITDLKTGALVMNTQPMSAADWVLPGNAVIPIGLKLGTEKLPPGSYRFEVQASDSAGRQSVWQQATFTVE